MADACGATWRNLTPPATASTRIGPPDFFAKIVDAYLTGTGNQGARVGDAMSYVFGARGLLDFALPLMEAVALDPSAADNLSKRDGHL
jgi:hypothetical protein